MLPDVGLRAPTPGDATKVSTMGGLDDELRRIAAEDQSRLRQLEVEATQGRALVSEFVERAKQRSIAPTPIFCRRVERHHHDTKRGPFRTRLPRDETVTTWHKVGDGWMLRNRGSDHSHSGYDFIVPGLGLCQVARNTLPTPGTRSQPQKAHFRAGVRQGESLAVVTTLVDPVVAKQMTDGLVCDALGHQFILALTSANQPDNSDAAYSVWAYAATQLAHSLERYTLS